MTPPRAVRRVLGALRRLSTLAVATVLAVLGWSATATGCPVCFAADERTRVSFLGTAVLLSALPFVLFAGFAFWFWRELDRATPTRAGGGSGPGTSRSARSPR